MPTPCLPLAFFASALFCLLANACHREKTQQVPAEFEPYVSRFFEEARARGRQLYLSDVDLVIEKTDLADPGINGTCFTRSHRVAIDGQYWDQAEEEEKEWLMFHELGHCVLGREHRNDKTPSGECLSILRGDENGFTCSANLYSALWRGYYLNELFSEKTPLSGWYTIDSGYLSVPATAQVLAAAQDTLVGEWSLDNIPFDQYENYLLELEFRDWAPAANLLRLSLGDVSFKYCNCQSGKIEIYQPAGPRLFYHNDELVFPGNTKLSIRKQYGVLRFYLNEQLIHSMESGLQSGNALRIPSFEPAVRLGFRVLSWP